MTRRIAAVGLLVGALGLASCGDGESATETGAPAEVTGATEGVSSPDAAAQQIKRVGARWADLFGRADEAMCELATGSLSDPAACEEFTGDPRPPAYQRSFRGARVGLVRVRDGSACATFTNGREVEFEREGDRWGPSNVSGRNPCGLPQRMEG